MDYASASSFTYEYFLKDHLGNTRVVVSPNGASDATVLQTDNYYPFGMSYASNTTSGTSNKYQYNGKELQDETLGGVGLGWYDYGARFYDPQIGRWTTQDPLMEWHFKQSPYNYCYNNPIRFIDPDGMEADLGVSDNLEKAKPKPKPQPAPTPIREVVIVGHRPYKGPVKDHVETGVSLVGEEGKNGTNREARVLFELDWDFVKWFTSWVTWNRKYEKPENPIPNEKEEKSKKALEEGIDAGKESDEKIKEATGDKTGSDGKTLDKIRRWQKVNLGIVLGSTYQDPSGDSVLYIGPSKPALFKSDKNGHGELGRHQIPLN